MSKLTLQPPLRVWTRVYWGGLRVKNWIQKRQTWRWRGEQKREPLPSCLTWARSGWFRMAVGLWNPHITAAACLSTPVHSQSWEFGFKSLIFQKRTDGAAIAF